MPASITAPSIWTSSPPSLPRIAAPRMRSVAASITIFINPAVSSFSMACATQLIGILPIFSCRPVARASRSVIPTRPSLRIGEHAVRNLPVVGGKRFSLDQIAVDDLPSVRNGEFARWFNRLSPGQLDDLWKNRVLRDAVECRLRSPVGFHEWLPVSRAPKFKEWGVTAEQIRDFRTPTRDVKFTKPGVHGGDFSTMRHNEIFRLIDESKDFESFKKALRLWADENLVGGSGALPPGLR